MGTLRQSIARWLNASIGNRFGTVLLALTLGFLVVTGAGNFAYLLYLKQQAAAEALAEANRDAVESFGRTLIQIKDDIGLLAGNPTVGSAVLDAHDQESYLYPLLSRYRPQGRTPTSLCVTDYKGRALGCASPGANSRTNDAWVKRAIDGNEAAVRIRVAVPNRPVLSYVHPIVYAGTADAEGAVVAEYDLVQLLQGAVPNLERYDHVHLASGGGDLYFAGQRHGIVHAGLDLALGDVLAPLQLHLSLGMSDQAFNAPLLQWMAVYGLAAVFVVAAAFWAARRAVPPLIARLSAMTVEANRVAAGETTTFAVATAGDDEIGQLARSFATMSARLKEINLSLEAQIEARTAELRQQEALLQSVLDAVPGVIFQFRLWPDGRSSLPFVSHALRDLYGLDPNEVNGDAARCFARVHPEDIAAHLASIEASARDLAYWQQDFRVVRPDGAVLWLRGNAKPQRQADGSVLWHGIIMDVTDHKRAEIDLADSEAYSKALFRNSHTPLVVMDPATGAFIDCNEMAAAIYGLGSRENVVGKTVADVSSPTQYDGTPSAEAAQAHIAAACISGLHVFEWQHRRPNGELWDAEVGLMGFRHHGKQLLQFSLRDMTEQKRSEADIWRKANFDGLTGLANRSLCLDRLERAIAQGRRNGHKVGVLFIDLDGFKGINDVFGHAVGDELLIEVARRLEGCVREQDTAARFGGDEFVLVIQDLAASEHLRRVAEDVIELLHQPFILAGNACKISGSIGIAVFPDDANSGEAVLALADKALYQSKRAGKDRYCCHWDGLPAEGAACPGPASPAAVTYK